MNERVAVLCGGVGAAKFLRGLVEVVDPSRVVAIVNVGDDTELHGLHISPDIDTVTYTLADAIDPVRGWGLAGESWQAMEQFGRFGNPTWFNLGDRDLATHIVRTERLRGGATLSTVTAELAESWGVGVTITPVTDDRLRTVVTVVDDEDAGEHEVTFQEYFVGRQHDVPVSAVRFDGADTARPADGVLDAIDNAARVIIAPSNPLVSIGPVLAVDAMRAGLESRRDDVVAVSPIVGGAALKGPADRMMRELGHESSVLGVARIYAEIAGSLVLDEVDAASADDVAATGVRPIVTDTIMSDVDRAAALASVVLG